MTNKGTRTLLSLKRYISLLHQEENRLNWLISSTLATERTGAEISARAVIEKLRNAEKELGELEGIR
jgi:hypothetical protein